MRIYRRNAFMELPSGTIYAKGKPWYFESLCVKGETIFHDGEASVGAECGFVWVDADDSGQAIDRLEAMLNSGESYPMETDYGRDGCFNDKDLFLVFERADLEQLRNLIDAAIAVSR